MKIRIDFRDILTTASLKLKKSILKLVTYVFLIISAHCFLELPLTFSYQPWDNWESMKKFPQTSLTLSHTLDTTVQSFLHHKNVMG